MPAISIKVGTKYACNNSFVEDHICLQSYHTIALKVFKKFQSPYNMVPIVTDITGIFGS